MGIKQKTNKNCGGKRCAGRAEGRQRPGRGLGGGAERGKRCITAGSGAGGRRVRTTAAPAPRIPQQAALRKVQARLPRAPTRVRGLGAPLGTKRARARRAGMPREPGTRRLPPSARTMPPGRPGARRRAGFLDPSCSRHLSLMRRRHWPPGVGARVDAWPGAHSNNYEKSRADATAAKKRENEVNGRRRRNGKYEGGPHSSLMHPSCIPRA